MNYFLKKTYSCLVLISLLVCANVSADDEWIYDGDGAWLWIIKCDERVDPDEYCERHIINDFKGRIFINADKVRLYGLGYTLTSTAPEAIVVNGKFSDIRHLNIVNISGTRNNTGIHYSENDESHYLAYVSINNFGDGIYNLGTSSLFAFRVTLENNNYATIMGNSGNIIHHSNIRNNYYGIVNYDESYSYDNNYFNNSTYGHRNLFGTGTSIRNSLFAYNNVGIGLFYTTGGEVAYNDAYRNVDEDLLCDDNGCAGLYEHDNSWNQ